MNSRPGDAVRSAGTAEFAVGELANEGRSAWGGLDRAGGRRTTGSPAGETVRILLNNDLKLTVPVEDGRFSGTFDTGPLPDGPYTIYADVPDGNGYQFSAGTAVYVDEEPDDIAVTSPAPGSTITSFGSEGLVIAGRVARPDVVERVTPIIGERSLRGIFSSVAEDGTFRMVVDAHDVPQGPVRIAVLPWDCSDWAVCGALGTSAVTVKVTPSAVITAPTAGQVFEWGTSRVSLGLQVTNPGPGDQVNAVIDGKLTDQRLVRRAMHAEPVRRPLADRVEGRQTSRVVRIPREHGHLCAGQGQRVADRRDRHPGRCRRPRLPDL